MSRKANPVAVGGFVLGGLALAVAGVVFFGGGNLFAETTRSVIYFDGSVNGLQVGSAVKLEGVEIGEVVQIRAIAALDQGLETFTETVIEVDRARFEQRGFAVQDSDQRLIDEGLRARLELQSLITGQLYVALLILPDVPARLVALPDAPYAEIPAVPKTIEEIERTVKGLVERIQKLPLEDLVVSLDSAVAGFDRFMNDPELASAVANLNGTLAEARGAVREARGLVKNVDQKVGPLAESAAAALDQAQQTLASAERSIEPGSPLGYQLTQTLRELAEASRAIRVLAEYLEENPNSLVFGRSSGEPE
jgi:paraquat-inducible protein B